MCEVICHCSFDLHFSSNECSLASFHVFISHLSSVVKCLLMELLPTFLNWIACFSDIVLHELLVYFGN